MRLPSAASEDISAGAQASAGITPQAFVEDSSEEDPDEEDGSADDDATAPQGEEGRSRWGYKFRKAQVRHFEEKQSLCSSDSGKKQRKVGFIQWHRDFIAAGHQLRPTGACKSKSECHGVNGVAKSSQREVGKEEQFKCFGARRARRQPSSLDSSSFFFWPEPPLPFGGSTVLRLARGPAGNQTTTGSLSAPSRTTPYQLSHEDT